MALAPVGGDDAADHPYIPVSAVRGFRVNNDGTFTQIVTVTAESSLYQVQFTFTILAATFDADGGPPLTAERTAWVDEICGHAHVQDFWSEVDQGPSQVLYNYGVITVGTDDGAITNQVRARMDQLNDPATFAAIDKAWKQLQALGAS
jgi:hypothetical protein